MTHAGGLEKPTAVCRETRVDGALLRFVRAIDEHLPTLGESRRRTAARLPHGQGRILRESFEQFVHGAALRLYLAQQFGELPLIGLGHRRQRIERRQHLGRFRRRKINDRHIDLFLAERLSTQMTIEELQAAVTTSPGKAIP